MDEEQNQQTQPGTVPYPPSELPQNYKQEAIDIFLKARTSKRSAITGIIITLIPVILFSVSFYISLTSYCQQPYGNCGSGIALFILAIPCAIISFVGFISTIIGTYFYFSSKKEFKRKFQKEWPSKADIKKIESSNKMKKSSNTSVVFLWTLGALCGAVSIIMFFIFIFMGIYEATPLIIAIALMLISILFFIVGNNKDKGK